MVVHCSPPGEGRGVGPPELPDKKRKEVKNGEIVKEGSVQREDLTYYSDVGIGQQPTRNFRGWSQEDGGNG